MLPRFFLAALLIIVPLTAKAQPLTRAACQQIIESAPWHLLQSRGNTRFASEMLPVHRPSLTFNGFDNTRDGLNASAGHGLRQALAEVFSTNPSAREPRPSDSFVRLHERLSRIPGAITSASSLVRPLPADEASGLRDSMEFQASEFQTLSLVALTSLLFEYQGKSIQQYNECLASLVVNGVAPQVRIASWADLRTIYRGVLIAGVWRYGSRFDEIENGDKLRQIVAKLGSSIDLYLAYENAVEMIFPSNTSQWLLADHIKTGYFNGIQVNDGGLSLQLAKTLIAMDNRRMMYNNLNRYQVEPGNWTTLVQASIAYAALATQASAEGVCIDECFTVRYWVDRGLRASVLDYPGSDIEQADNYTYDYTSHEGRMWGEGPYYLQYAVPSLVSFWHAVRVNQLGTRAGTPYSSGLPNPFLPLSWHLGPLRWLADLTTPQGQTPPLDDGNRHVMAGAYLLAWNGAYGEGSADLGARFAWISRKTNENLRTELIDGEDDDSDVSYAMLALAIPPATTEQAPTNTYGPTASDGTQADHLIVRNASSYVLLNGEGRASMTSMTRGHGHEQPDNMNLMWYVGRGSALMDAGYDRGTLTGSTWREYNHQNVLYLDGPRNCLGLRNWDLQYDPDDLSDPPRSWHTPAAELDLETVGNLRVLRGRQTLNGSVPLIADQRFVVPENDCGFPSADYRRDVIVVGDQEYLIDLNANLVSGDIDYNPTFSSVRRHQVRYTIGSTSMSPSAPSGDAFWSSGPLMSNAEQRVHLLPLGIEAPFSRASHRPSDISVMNRGTRERTGQDVSAIAFTVTDPNAGRTFTTATVITVQPTTPTTRPIRVPMAGGYAAFAWRRPKADGSTDVDLYVARSSGALPGGTIYVNPAQVSTYDPLETNGQFPNAWFTLAPGVRYGFVRLNRASNGTVTTVPNYNLNLVPSSTHPALTATLVAPVCAQTGVPATMRVHIGGGLPWYEVQFETKPVGTGGGGGGEAALIPTNAPSLNLSLPTPGGTGGGVGSNGVPVNSWSYAGGPQPSVDLTRSESYDIRARVTDRNGASVLTPSERVTVQTMPCDDGTGTPPPAPDVAAEDGALASRARPMTLTVEGLRPNPASSRAALTVGMPSREAASLVAYDLLGREVARETLDGASGWAEASLDVSAWPSGLYLVRVTQGAAAQTVRLTVRH